MEKSQRTLDDGKSYNPFSVKDKLKEIDKVLENNPQLLKEKQYAKIPVYKESTSTKIRSSATTVRKLRNSMKKEAEKAVALAKNNIPGYVEPEYILDLTKELHRFGEKSAAEYVSRNKKILLSEHALKTKQQDICRMKKNVEKLEAEVLEEERKLEKDAHNFNAFIKNINTLSSLAVERLVEETKLKFKKTEEVRSLKADIFLLESQIAKLESLLSEYLICANFLEAAKPQSKKERMIVEYILDTEMTGSNLSHLLTDESLDPIEISFKDESELLKAISRFRDQNLNIVTNSHFVRKSLINAQTTYNVMEEKMTNDLIMYSKQIACLQDDIKNNKEKTKNLEELATIASARGLEEEMQSQKTLEPKITATYEMCTEIKGGKMSFTMMITAIESFLSELLFEIRSLPEKALMKVYMLKQVERKGQKRREDEERRAKIQEERIRQTEERRRAPAKLMLKRRLLYQPQATKQVQKKEEIVQEILKPEDDDYSYFFS